MKNKMNDCESTSIDTLAAIIVEFLIENQQICVKHCNLQNVSTANEMLCLQAWNLLVQIDTYCNQPVVDDVIYESYSQVCMVQCTICKKT